MEQKLFDEDKVSEFSDLLKLDTNHLPSGFEMWIRDNFILFAYMSVSDESPTIFASVRIDEDLTINVSFKGVPVNGRHVAHVLRQRNKISAISEVSNVLAFVKSWISSENYCAEEIVDIAVDLLETARN